MDLELLKNKTGLVLEGGGILGVSYLGTLSRLEELGIQPSQFKYYAGTSAGSIIASALACGCTVEMLTDIMKNQQFEKFKDDSVGVIRDTYRLLKHFGWHKGKYLEKWAYDTLGTITGNPEITFEEVYTRYGNYLVIPVMKNYEVTIYYDRFSTPNVPIYKAVRRSAGIPLYYQADTDTHVDSDDDSDKEGDNQYDMYTDGGALDNFPFHKLANMLGTDKVLGLKLLSTTQLHEINHGTKTSPPKNILEMAIKLVSALRNQAMRLHIKEEYWEHSIKINVGDIDSTNFNITPTELDWLYKQGRTAVNETFGLPIVDLPVNTTVVKRKKRRSKMKKQPLKTNTNDSQTHTIFSK